MKYSIMCFLVALVFSFHGVAQEKNSIHKVEKGETITQIAQKYNVTPFDIYQLNPDAQSGVKPNDVLLIPKKATVKKKNSNVLTHKVEPKETLYSITTKYAITEEALKKANPALEQLGLQIGQMLVIPSYTNAAALVSPAEKLVYHEVLPKETKYSIAKQYGLTVEELEKKNPEIIPNLTIGYRLIIKGTAPKITDYTKETTPIVPKVNYIDYKVAPKETLYSLSKMAGLSQEELVRLNPALSDGVETGMIIKVPESASIPQEVEIRKSYSNLSAKSNVNARKKLVMLLPFNLTKIEGDTVNSTSTRLKKDKFLTMTLDFYAGALQAIDSAKTIGLPVDVSIYDSQETKNSSNILNIHKQYNLEIADAIIGPFYQNNVEIVASLVEKYKVAVISPLSKDIGNSLPNLFQAIPTADNLKSAIFEYMIQKGGNIIAVVDKKKESARQFIQQNYPEVQFAALLENGSLSTASLKSLFVKDKMNYVLLASENTGMIKYTMSTMLSVMASYKVELVIMEPNPTLDTDEISFENLTKLKLMYPSIARENESAEALIFENEYRKKNKIAPNTFASRGFDVTFDTLMRLSQDKTYQETIADVATEQVDNKFEYYKKPEGGYTNKGIYILYYDTDLRIKEAN